MNSAALKNSSAFTEFKTNKRLQWLLFAILCILLISLLKNMADSNAEAMSGLQTQQNLVSKLHKSSKQSISAEFIEQISKQASILISDAPNATSMSVAEALALSAAEKLNKDLFNRGRTKLIGTEEITIGQHTFYQVRIELAGNLKSAKLTDFLSNFDGSKAYQRVNTFRMRFARTNSTTAVVDYLYLGGS